MSDIELIRILSNKARDSKSDIDIFRSYCHSISVQFILSTEIFPSNAQLETFLVNNKHFQVFLINNEKEFRPYLFKNRTQIIARVIRIIERSEKSDLELLLKMVREIVFHKPSSPNNKQEKNENYFDTMIKQLYRGE